MVDLGTAMEAAVSGAILEGRHMHVLRMSLVSGAVATFLKPIAPDPVRAAIKRLPARGQCATDAASVAAPGSAFRDGDGSVRFAPDAPDANPAP